MRLLSTVAAVVGTLACVALGSHAPVYSGWSDIGFGDLPTVEEMSLAPESEVRDALLLHPVAQAGLMTSTSGLPWDTTVALDPSQCDVDGEARDLAVIRLVWAEREFVGDKKEAYRFKKGDVIRAPTYNAPCAYRLVHRLQEPDVSSSSNQAGIFVRHDTATGRDIGPVVLVFRGSAMDLSMDAVKDWVNNLRIRPRKCKLPSGSVEGKCHSGFLEGLQNMEASVRPMHLARKLADAVGAKEILVGGSSLGGAMATLAALDLTRTQGRPVKLFTHGSPRVGNAQFAKAVDNTIAYSARYVGVSPCTEESLRTRGKDTSKASDVITRMPFKQMGYRHIAGAKVVPCLTPCRKETEGAPSFLHRMYSDFVTAIYNTLKGEDHESRPNLFVSFKCHLAYTKSLWHMYARNQNKDHFVPMSYAPYISYEGEDRVPRMTTYEELAKAIVDDIINPQAFNEHKDS